MSDRALRVGIIGVGAMGTCHARNIAELTGAELAWVADPDEDAGRTLAADVGTEWIADGHDGLDRCDAVVIACPDRFHAEFTLDALSRELAVFCEKPLTADLNQAVEILEAEVAIGRRLIQVGFMRVYDQRHVQVQQALRTLGEVNHVRCVHRNTADKPRSVPAMLVESIIHDIHSVRWLSRSEISEVATASVHRDRGPCFVLLTCRLSNGGVASIEFDDSAAGYEVSVEVSAENGNVVAAEPSRAVVRVDGTVGAELAADWFAPFLETYRAEMRSWLDSILAGQLSGPSAWDGYAAQAVAETAAASELSGTAEPVVLMERPALYGSARS